MLTHTRPGPPPGAGVAAPVLAPLAGGGLASAGLVAAAEVFGLNKSPKIDLAADGETAGLVVVAASAFLRVRFPVGDAAGDGDSAGLVTVAASAFLNPNPAVTHYRRFRLQQLAEWESFCWLLRV